MAESIRIGPWSMFLLVLAAQAIVVAFGVVAQRSNRRANRYLAALLIVLAGMLTPFIIGYAGFYDAYPWLSFAPFATPLAVGPLLYGHLRALVTGQNLAGRHWLAPAAQFAYQAVCFIQPLATKAWIDDAIQRPFLTPLTSAAAIASLAGYSFMCLRLVSRYQRGAGLSDAAKARLRRLRRPTIALVALLLARFAFDAWDALIAPLDYFDLFPFYVLLALLTGWLSLEGWRGSAVSFPPLSEGRDFGSEGAVIRARIASEQWWREPDLSLSNAARRLATNETFLSKALNASGPGFAETIAMLRAEGVAVRLEAGERTDLLTIALACGFGSKASFNRAFRARYGCSPSTYAASFHTRMAPAGN